MKLTIDTTLARHCAKCDTNEPPLFRHHKGCDGLLGQFNKGIVGNYQKWLECVDLCMKHHCEIHYLYNVTFLDHWINRSPQGARAVRKKLVALCNRWLAGKVKVPTLPNYYLREFAAGFESWKDCKAKQAAAEKLHKKITGHIEETSGH